MLTKEEIQTGLIQTLEKQLGRLREGYIYIYYVGAKRYGIAYKKTTKPLKETQEFLEYWSKKQTTLHSKLGMLIMNCVLFCV